MSLGKAGRNSADTPDNDKVMTPAYLAKQCVDMLSPHFKPEDTFLEPCYGTGAFYNLMPANKDWCEIDKGRDFFEYKGKVDWIITNPPYSIYEEFLKQSMSVADNVVFLLPLSKIWSSLRRIKLIDDYGGVRHFHIFKNGARKFGFPFGFPMCLVWIKKDYKSPPVFTGELQQSHPKERGK